MTTKHKHDHCSHINLKYCEHCKVVHCLDCEQEFPETITVTVEKIIYKERGWGYPYVSYEGSALQDDSFVRDVSDKTVFDKDRFERTVTNDLLRCVKHS